MILSQIYFLRTFASGIGAIIMRGKGKEDRDADGLVTSLQVSALSYLACQQQS
jgi:hypothetical protein